MIRTFSAALVLAGLTWGSHAHAQALPLTDAPPLAATAPATTVTPAPTTTSETPQQADRKEPAKESGAAPTEKEETDDAVLDRSQPDFTLINLPTGLRLPKWKSAFRVTHRFTRPLGEGTFGNLAADAFGLDSGAIIGLEFRMGVAPGAQVGIYRTNDRTIEFFGQYDLKQQSESFPVGLAAYASVDGTNNFRDSYSPALGVIVTRELGEYGAVYAEPIFVNNTDPRPSELTDDNSTFIIGIGARIRIRPTTYVVGEFVPRVSGFSPDKHAMSFALEKRVGGHAFQLVFSNTFGLTMAQIARGGFASADGSSNWYMGFNISRKFF